MPYLKISEIISGDPNLFKVPILFTASSIAFESMGDYVIPNSSIESFKFNIRAKNRKTLILRILQSVGLLNQYLEHLSYGMHMNNLNSNSQLKLNKKYTLSIQIRNDGVDILKKTGFGFFGGMNDIITVYSSIVRAYNNYIMKRNPFNLNAQELEFLNDILSKNQFADADTLTFKALDAFITL